MKLLVLLAFALLVVGRTGWSLHVGAFNLHIFGPTKAANTEVKSVLSKIIRRYDIILLQEIRDAAQTAIHDLLAAVNRDEQVYDYSIVVGPRLGRSSSKEQYAYMYRTQTVRVLDYYTYNDTVLDEFEREPLVVQIKDLTDRPIDDLVLIGIHIRPSDTVTELDALVSVHEHAAMTYATTNIIHLGDMNADCGFLSNTAYNQLSFTTDDRFHWLIDKDADTTVAVSECSYDRFVSTAEVNARLVTGSVIVYRFDMDFNLTFDQTMDVSDHYPIELQLQGPMTSDLTTPPNPNNDSGGGGGAICHPSVFLSMITGALFVLLYCIN